MLIVLALMGCVLTDKLDAIDDTGSDIDSCQPLMTVQCHDLEYDTVVNSRIICYSDEDLDSSYVVISCGYSSVDVGTKAIVVENTDGGYTAYYNGECLDGCRLTIEFSPAE